MTVSIPLYLSQSGFLHVRSEPTRVILLRPALLTTLTEPELPCLNEPKQQNLQRNILRLHLEGGTIITNETIIFNHRYELMQEGILASTSRTIKSKLKKSRSKYQNQKKFILTQHGKPSASKLKEVSMQL